MSAPIPTKRPDLHPHDDGALKKRRKGATRLSCAECRRLKLRCDRTVPCSSCVKRGCGAICPDGSLTTGQGNRFVLASTEELHGKISELATRVRELEDALRASHSRMSNDPHPLLKEDLLRIKAPLQREPAHQRNATHDPGEREEESNPDVVDAFGTLSLSLSGHAKYYGQTANSWYWLQNEQNEEPTQYRDPAANLVGILPQEILQRAAAFPVTPGLHATSSDSDPACIQNLLWYLPEAQRAAELRDIYYRHAAWLHNPITEESFDFEVYQQFYGQIASPVLDDPLLAHRLSVMFLVLAIGTHMDPSRPGYCTEAEKYFQLARAALFSDSFVDAPTVNAVQALYLMTFYLFLADRHGTASGTRWAFMGLAVKMAETIGLHRDSARWEGIDLHETQRRRELFWEMFSYDSWQALTLGQPSSFALSHFDCKMPHSSQPSDEMSFYAWKHRFTSECMSLLHDQAFGARTPTYATVLQLDRKLRSFPVPPILQVAGFGNSEARPGGFPDTPMLTLQRHIVLAIREMNLLYLHRSFFARAIGDSPKDPLGSPYGTSVIAAYRSAGSLVALMRNLHAQLKQPAERLWFLWGHMFSCSIVLGSIVTRCPSMSFAPSALVQLDSACELFSKAADGFRAHKVLDIMLALQRRAHHSLEDFRRGLIPGSPGSRGLTVETNGNDELAMLGGRSRLVKREDQAPSPLILDRSPNSLNPVVPLPLSTTMHMDSNALEYLSSFNTNQHQHVYLDQQQTPASASSHGSGSYHEMDLSPASRFDSMNGHIQMQHQPHSASSATFPPDVHTPYNHRQASLPSFHSSMDMGGSRVTHGHHTIGSHPNGNGMNGHTNGAQNGDIHNQQIQFPTYFPVYDYNFGAGQDNGFAPLLESVPRGQHQRRSSSNSPDTNTMQSTWQDFVALQMDQSKF
ncbi:hypothetical protein CYLTODRAFT_452841 [Cylindrobasidium torrendii FP15055 ss-10]|uniref:Zn(2)-C6 fungal-type domain-containing protein n=1 Tax=Cylindrobasidium torrendii FP15055 ss-10 TaxID=1314674 RepID=A0A0D7BHX4_9AGAR|nr:hypothetical protein CYLTODRAFT_452841 [Cylindrobasidium torrendii FP15055 ss-10]